MPISLCSYGCTCSWGVPESKVPESLKKISYGWEVQESGLEYSCGHSILGNFWFPGAPWQQWGEQSLPSYIPRYKGLLEVFLMFSSRKFKHGRLHVASTRVGERRRYAPSSSRNTIVNKTDAVCTLVLQLQFNFNNKFSSRGESYPSFYSVASNYTWDCGSISSVDFNIMLLLDPANAITSTAS